MPSTLAPSAQEAIELARLADRDEFLRLVGDVALGTTPVEIWLGAEYAYKTGRFALAINGFSRFERATAKRQVEPWLKWHALLRRAHAELRLGQYKTSRDRSPVLREALEAKLELGPLRCELYAFDALIFDYKGILEKSAALFQLAYEAALAEGHHRRAANFASETGRVLALLGRLGPAWDWQRRAEESERNFRNGQLRRQIMTRSANLLRALEQFPEAERLYVRALELPGADQQPEAMIAVLSSLAELEVIRERYDIASRHLDAALKISVQAGLTFRTIYLYRDYARLYFTRGDAGDLERSHEQLQRKLKEALALPLMPRHLVEHLAGDLVRTELALGKDGRKSIAAKLKVELEDYSKTLRPHLFGQKQRMKTRRAASRKVRESLRLLLEPWVCFTTCRVNLHTGICRFEGGFGRLGRAQLEVLLEFLRAKGRALSEADLHRTMPDGLGPDAIKKRLQRLQKGLRGSLLRADSDGESRYYVTVVDQFRLKEALASLEQSGTDHVPSDVPFESS